MARLDLHDKFFTWLGTFDERILARDAGFKFDSTLSAWVTDNAYRAWRVREKTSMNISEAAWRKLYPLDLKLNISRMVNPSSPLTGNATAQRAKSGSELFPFQRIPAYYLEDAHRRKPILICDDPGTGKTMQALSIVNMDKTKSILVVCPANKREDWATAIEDWCDMPPARIGYSEVPAHVRPGTVHITSWNLLAQKHIQNWLLTQRFQNLIGDEIHYAKTYQATRTQGFFRIARHVKRTIGLSGTFPPNFPIELWPFLRFARRHLSGFPYASSKEFLYAFCVVGVHNNRPFIIGTHSEDELQFHLRANIMVRRTIDDVFPELPPPILRFQTIESNEIIDRLEAEQQPIAKEFLERDYTVAKMPVGKLAKLRAELSVLKAPFIVEYAKNVLASEDKLVILGHHTEMLNYIFAHLNREFGAVLITGKVPANKKHEYKEQFQGDLNVRVCVGNIKACGEAIELTSARYGLFAEASWVPGENEQGVGRIRRYGQIRQTYWDFLNVRNSLDERVLRRALRKAADLREVRDNPIEGEQAWLHLN